LGFFFTQAEKNSLYAEKFADIIRSSIDPASLQPYLNARLHAGAQSMMWVDLMSYLPDDILAKVDRMSMACSLEVRVPLLDHRVVEFMAQVEKKQKYTQFNNKILLRDLAQRYLPKNILQRPKQGFAIPLGAWLQRELKPMVDEVLAPARMRQRGLFNPDHVERMVKEHQQGRRDYSQQLWAMLILELWLERLLGSKAAV
jgi:asparagine synthase (glutamine-hydrolysing)